MIVTGGKTGTTVLSRDVVVALVRTIDPAGAVIQFGCMK